MASNALALVSEPVRSAALVRHLQQATGLNGVQVARVFGVHVVSAWRWATGAHRMPRSARNLARLLIHDPSLVLVLRQGDVPRSVVRFVRASPVNREALSQVLLCLGDDAAVFALVADTLASGVRAPTLAFALGRFAERVATMREPTLAGLTKTLGKLPRIDPTHHRARARGAR